MQGLSGDESLQRAKDNFASLTVRNWKFWIPAQLVQFALLPEELQVPYTCAMGLVWNVILSVAAGSAREPAPVVAEQVGVVVPSAKQPASASKK